VTKAVATYKGVAGARGDGACYGRPGR